MSIIYYTKKVLLQNYANFNGRASRSEYWYFTLFNVLICIALYIGIFIFAMIGASMSSSSGSETAGNIVAVFAGIIYVVLLLYGLAILIPSIAVTVRRLHDIGKSGFWYFISFIPCGIGTIWMIILMITESDGENEYGDVPED